MMSRCGRRVSAGWVCALLCAGTLSEAQTENSDDHPDVQFFLVAGTAEGTIAQEAIAQIGDRWRDGYAGMVWDLARSLRPPGPQMFRFFSLLDLLQRHTGQSFGGDLVQWQQWIWAQPYDPHPDYGFFKGQWYGRIDRQFADFFPRGVKSSIRLDEVVWGGVGVNGIPPLEYPAHISAHDARYLSDEDIVFGIAVGNETRAYPKRILAWHEMALDRLGDIELTIVYCTLCGTVIPFESVVDGRHFTFGTSGLLYRSNKLMFDHETRSLWNTFQGIPIVGSLTDSSLRLSLHSVVTTTWGAWRRRHPSTTVLSLDTGYPRDYTEGAAYRDYFATDTLMFQVARRDDRLPNKAEVLVLTPGGQQVDLNRPLAIATNYLLEHPVFQVTREDYTLLVLTSTEGANRVYEAGDLRVSQYLDETRVVDEYNRSWRITESALIRDDAPEDRRRAVPAHRAFWFGWYAQFPDTELIH